LKSNQVPQSLKSLVGLGFSSNHRPGSSREIH
jgi:hypothetical protein